MLPWAEAASSSGQSSLTCCCCAAGISFLRGRSTGGTGCSGNMRQAGSCRMPGTFGCHCAIPSRLCLSSVPSAAVFLCTTPFPIHPLAVRPSVVPGWARIASGIICPHWHRSLVEVCRWWRRSKQPPYCAPHASSNLLAGSTLPTARLGALCPRALGQTRFCFGPCFLCGHFCFLLRAALGAHVARWSSGSCRDLRRRHRRCLRRRRRRRKCTMTLTVHSCPARLLPGRGEERQRRKL